MVMFHYFVYCFKKLFFPDGKAASDVILSEPEWLIKNGEDSQNHRFHVGLISSKTKKLFCSGSLISSLYVLTAVHCVR